MSNLEVTVEQLRGMEGTQLGAGQPFVVTQERVDQFAEATGDYQWIHCDPVRSAKGPFGTTIAHGYLTLSLIPLFMRDLLTITDEVRGTNYGVERVRFPNVVPVGSALTMSGRVHNIVDRPDGGVQYSVAVIVAVNGSERPSLAGDVTYLTYGP